MRDEIHGAFRYHGDLETRYHIKDTLITGEQFQNQLENQSNPMGFIKKRINLCRKQTSRGKAYTQF